MKAFGDENEATPDSAPVYFWGCKWSNPWLRPPEPSSIQSDGRFIQANRRTWLHLQPDATSNFFVWFLLCKQGYECLEFADNAIVDGAYTYNTITAAIYFEVHNQFHIVKIQIAELLWQNCCGIFSDDL